MPDVVGRAVYELDVDNTKLDKGLQGATGEIKKTGVATEKAFSQQGAASLGKYNQAVGGLRGSFGGLAQKLGTPALSGGILQGVGLGGGLIAFQAVGAAVSSAISYMVDAVSAASDLNETVSKSRVIFGEGSKAIEDWASTAATSMGQSTKEALDTASGFAGLFQTVGLAADVSAEKAKNLTQLGADLASFFNTDVADAIGSLKSGLSGESEPLRKFNVFLSDTAVKAKLTSQGIKAVGGQFTEAQKATARYALILEQTSTAQGDFGRTSDGLANSQRIVSAELENLKAKIGQGLMQVFVGLMPVIKGVVGAVGVLVDAIGSLGTAFNELHRFIDPNLAAAQDFEAALRKQATATGHDADAVVAYVAAQKARAEADRQAAIDADGSIAGSKADMVARQALAQAQIDQMAAQYGLSAAEKTAMEVSAGLRDETGALTTTQIDAAAALQASVDSTLAGYDRAAAGADANAIHVTRYGDTTVAVAALVEEAAAAAEAAQVAGYRAAAAQAATSGDKVRAANKAVIDSFASMAGADGIKASLKAMVTDVKGAMKEMHWAIEHPDAWMKTRKELEGQLAKATKAMAKAVKENKPEVVGAIQNVIDKINADLAKLPPKATSIGNAWINSLAFALQQGHMKIEDALAEATGGMVGRSPPRTGPLRYIGIWGRNVAKAWLEPFLAMLGEAQSAVDAKLGGISMGLGAGAAIAVSSQQTIRHEHAGTIQVALHPSTVSAMRQAGYSGQEVGLAARAASGIDGLLRNLTRESLLAPEAF